MCFRTQRDPTNLVIVVSRNNSQVFVSSFRSVLCLVAMASLCTCNYALSPLKSGTATLSVSPAAHNVVQLDIYLASTR